MEELPAIVGGASGSAIRAANGKHGATSASRGFGVSQKSPQFFTNRSFSFPLYSLLVYFWGIREPPSSVSFGPAKERGNKSEPQGTCGELKFRRQISVGEQKKEEKMRTAAQRR